MHVPSCERARVGCSNGRARVSHQVCRSRRAAPDHHDAPRPRSERVDEGLATHPLPISRVPKGRGGKDGGSGSGRPESSGNRARAVKGMLDGCRGCIPGADHLARRATLAGGAACASRGQPASGSRNGRRRWKTFRAEEADSRSRAGREKRPRSSRGSAPHQRKRFARASRVRGWMTAKRQRLGPRAPVGRKRHRKARGPAEAGRSS